MRSFNFNILIYHIFKRKIPPQKLVIKLLIFLKQKTVAIYYNGFGFRVQILKSHQNSH